MAIDMAALIALAMTKPAGSMTEVDIIHRSLCLVHDTCDERDCTCTPEIKERLVN